MTEAEIKRAKIGDRVMFKPLSADAGEYSEGNITHKLGSRIEITWDDGEISTVSPHDYTRIFLKPATRA
jgi:hypothetical protein